MNKLLNIPNVSLKFMPHQIATADWINHTLDNKSSVLIFHKPGTGKTLIGVIMAITWPGKVIVSLSNTALLSIWNSELLSHCYTIPKVQYKTRQQMKTIFQSNEDFTDTLLIIDEAHEILGTSLLSDIIAIREKYKIKIVAMTGTPIMNTPRYLNKLLSFLSGEEIEYNLVSLGKVTDIKILDEHIETVNRLIKDVISYKDVDESNVAKYTIKDLMIPMLETQQKLYNLAMSQTENEMFSQVLVNTSLFALSTITNVDSIKKMKIFDGEAYGSKIDDMTYNNDLLYGGAMESIDKIKNYSCKLYKLSEMLLGDNSEASRGKMFIYLSNPGYGIIFIKSFFHLLRIADNESIMLYSDPLCHCGIYKSKHKKVQMTSNSYNNNEIYSIEQYVCNDDTPFSPMKYVVVTGLSQVNPLIPIEAFNDSNNKRGEKIKILVGSDIVSVGYTFNEVKSIHILSLAANFKEEEQIIKRVIRFNAHSNLKTMVNVYRYLATFKNSKDESHDMKKLYYIIKKYDNTTVVDELFIKASKSISSAPHKNMITFLTRELIRPPSIMKSIENIKSMYKKLLLEPDLSVVDDNIFIPSLNVVVSKNDTKPFVMPLNDYMIVTPFIYTLNKININKFIIIHKMDNYYYTTNYSSKRNINSYSFSELVDLFINIITVVEDTELTNSEAIKTDLMKSNKSEIIEKIIAYVKGTKYMISITDVHH